MTPDRGLCILCYLDCDTRCET